MTEYAKLMDKVVVTDEETFVPQRVSSSRIFSKRTIFGGICFVGVILFIVGSLSQKTDPSSSVSDKITAVSLDSDAPDVGEHTEPTREGIIHIENTLNTTPASGNPMDFLNFKFTEDTTYSERVRANIKNMMQNKTRLVYQPIVAPIRPLLNMYSKYQTESRYNLSACMTPKAMATTLHGIFCYLHDSVAFEKRNLTLETVYWNQPGCDFATLPRSLSTAKLTTWLPEKHNSFQVVREPIKRFVSAYINKCIDEYKTDPAHPNWKYCYDCKEDIECVITKARHDIMKRSRYDRLFKGPIDNQYFSEHFYPLTWQCELGLRYDSVHFIRYISGGPKKVSMVNQLLSVMQMSGVENNKLSKISGVLLDDKPLTHATKGTSLPHQLLTRIHNSQKMLDILTSLYYYDYIVFEYPLPKLGVISEFD